MPEKSEGGGIVEQSMARRDIREGVKEKDAVHEGKCTRMGVGRDWVFGIGIAVSEGQYRCLHLLWPLLLRVEGEWRKEESWKRMKKEEW